MKILVTGYQSFPGQGVNPTEAIADALDGQVFHGVEIVGKPIPVVWSKAQEEISGLVRDYQPSAIISFGVNAGITRLEIETTARNDKDGTYPDAEGKYESGPIIQGAPYKLFTAIPFDYIIEERGHVGNHAIQLINDVPATELLEIGTSDDAGTYLCNYALYNNIYQYSPKEISVRGFVHTRDVGTHCSLDQIKQSAAFVVASVAKWLTAQAPQGEMLMAARSAARPMN